MVTPLSLRLTLRRWETTSLGGERAAAAGTDPQLAAVAAQIQTACAPARVATAVWWSVAALGRICVTAAAATESLLILRGIGTVREEQRSEQRGTPARGPSASLSAEAPPRRCPGFPRRLFVAPGREQVWSLPARLLCSNRHQSVAHKSGLTRRQGQRRHQLPRQAPKITTRKQTPALAGKRDVFEGFFIYIYGI